MSNVSGQGNTHNLPNYLGAPLIAMGNNNTPLLNLIIGSEMGQNFRTVHSDKFALNSNYSFETPAQPAITETGASTAPTATSFVRAQDTNVVQIFQRKISVTYSKQGDYDNIAGLALANGENPVKNELEFQTATNLKQIYKDLNYTLINGAYQDNTTATTAAMSRGMLAAITTNVVTTTATLSKAILDSMFEKAYQSGCPFENVAIVCNSFQKRKVSSIYGYAPTDRNVGGVNIKVIETDYGNVMVLLDPTVPTNTILFVSLGALGIAAKEIPNKGTLFLEPLAKTGASEEFQLYGQLGIDYGHEAMHAKITGLATS